MNGTKLRSDIQVLRALAVLAVVIYHTDLGLLPGGFLGVDIFFVISGFLIGKAIMSSCDAGTFSFSQFYVRRIFRLIPATISTLVVTAALAAFVLTPSDWMDFQKQLLGSVTFTANFVLMLQSDYFAAAADRKPLLHMWSLAIEEQFYLFAPILIFFTPKNWRGVVMAVFGVLSLLACLTLMFGWIDLPISSKRAQTIAFYMLPTRAWELILGCYGGWLMLKRPHFQIPLLIKMAALAGVAFLLIHPIGQSHPAQDAIMVAGLTLLLLLGQDNWIPKSAVTSGTQKIGDWSYSIYLVHWPLFAFANSIFLAGMPIWVAVGLAILSIALGALQFNLVEKRFRYGWASGQSRNLVKLAVTTAIVALLASPPLTAILYEDRQRLTVSPPNVGLSFLCDQKGGEFINRAECRTSHAPRVALLGDSIAMQWGSVLAEYSDEIGGLVQMTKSACAPAMGVAQVHGRYTQVWAEDCISFVEDSVDTIVANEQIETVVISSGYTQVLKDDGQTIYSRKHNGAVGVERGLDAALATIERLTAAGKTVIIIGTPAMTGVDYGVCNQRRLGNLLTVGDKNCAFPVDEFKTEYSQLVDGLEAMAAIDDVTLVWPHDAYCTNGICQTHNDGKPIYRDRLHLTVEGTRLIADKLGLVNQISAK